MSIASRRRVVQYAAAACLLAAVYLWGPARAQADVLPSKAQRILRTMRGRTLEWLSYHRTVNFLVWRFPFFGRWAMHALPTRVIRSRPDLLQRFCQQKGLSVHDVHDVRLYRRFALMGDKMSRQWCEQMDACARGLPDREQYALSCGRIEWPSIAERRNLLAAIALWAQARDRHGRPVSPVGDDQAAGGPSCEGLLLFAEHQPPGGRETAQQRRHAMTERQCEVKFEVNKKLQNAGIGTWQTGLAGVVARWLGFESLVGDVFPENRRMHRTLIRNGAEVWIHGRYDVAVRIQRKSKRAPASRIYQVEVEVRKQPGLANREHAAEIVRWLKGQGAVEAPAEDLGLAEFTPPSHPARFIVPIDRILGDHLPERGCLAGKFGAVPSTFKKNLGQPGPLHRVFDRWVIESMLPPSLPDNR